MVRALNLFATLTTGCLTFAQTTLTPEQINNVRARLSEAALLSWELGTRAEALLEFDTPSFSVFTPSSVPPPKTAPDSLAPALAIAESVVGNLVNISTSGPRSLIPNGAAGDPASNGIIATIANWTQTSPQLNYTGALEEQLEFLLEVVPKMPNGAISHRVADAQLWSDFISMVPPFFAYYGVITHNTTLINSAVEQIRDYREILRDEDTGLWKHIIGTGAVAEDPKFWSTGQGWAAHGILRTLATILNSRYKHLFYAQSKELAGYVKEILDGVYNALPEGTYIFTNYITDNTSFPDAAGTTLLAASVYRAAIITGDSTWISAAKSAHSQLIQSNIDSDGWLFPVVNPHAFLKAGNKSAEAQAFVFMLEAAYERYTELNGVPERTLV